MAQRGSVFQRANGRWIASIRIGSKTIQRYAQSHAEAQQHLDTLLREHYQGTIAVPTKVQLSAWAEQWMSELELRPSTEKTYRDVLRPVLGEVGHYRLDKLTPSLLSLVFSGLAKKKLGARRRQLAHGYLRSCLERAVMLEILARNPMARVRRPEWKPRVRTLWDAAEASRFVQTCLQTESRWGPLFAVLASCGLRVSEALGLQSGDIDLTARVLRVRRAVVWYGQTYTVGEVKTRAAIRDVALPQVAVDALRRMQMPDDPSAFVFLTLNGRPPSPSHLRQPLVSLCAEAGLTPVNVHSIRHTHAALVYRSTKDAYATQRRLGHSDVTTTMRIYAYLMTDDSTVSAALDAVLSPPKPTDQSEDRREVTGQD